MRWFRSRKASDVPDDHREIFERFGASLIGTVLAGGFNPSTPDLGRIHNDSQVRANAAEWLTEQYDRAKRKETWSITIIQGDFYFMLKETWSSGSLQCRTASTKICQPIKKHRGHLTGLPFGSILAVRRSSALQSP